MQLNKKNKELSSAYNDMENYFFSSCSNMSNTKAPRLIFVFSSPGAGKTKTIKPQINQSFNVKPLNLEIDELKSFIPENVSDKAKIAGIWFQKILKRAMDKKLNIVIYRQRNLLLLNQTKHIIEEAKNKGYDTETIFIALNIKKSLLSVFKRYEEAVRNPAPTRADYPRKPNILRHYIFYKALPIALKYCEKIAKLDTIKVYNRDGNLLSIIDNKYNIKSKISPIRAFIGERSRSWSEKERTSHHQLKKDTMEKIKLRGNLKDILRFKLFVR